MQFFSFPSWADIVSSTQGTAQGIFTSLLPFMAFEIGIGVAALLLILIIRATIGGARHLTHNATSKHYEVSPEERASVAGSWEASREMWDLHNRG